MFYSSTLLVAVVALFSGSAPAASRRYDEADKLAMDACLRHSSLYGLHQKDKARSHEDVVAFVMADGDSIKTENDSKVSAFAVVVDPISINHMDNEDITAAKSSDLTTTTKARPYQEGGFEVSEIKALWTGMETDASVSSILVADDSMEDLVETDTNKLRADDTPLVDMYQQQQQQQQHKGMSLTADKLDKEYVLYLTICWILAGYLVRLAYCARHLATSSDVLRCKWLGVCVQVAMFHAQLVMTVVRLSTTLTLMLQQSVVRSLQTVAGAAYLAVFVIHIVIDLLQHQRACIEAWMIRVTNELTTIIVELQVEQAQHERDLELLKEKLRIESIFRAMEAKRQAKIRAEAKRQHDIARAEAKRIAQLQAEEKRQKEQFAADLKRQQQQAAEAKRLEELKAKREREAVVAAEKRRQQQIAEAKRLEAVRVMREQEAIKAEIYRQKLIADAQRREEMAHHVSKVKRQESSRQALSLRQQHYVDAEARRPSQYEAEDARPQDADAHRLYEQEAENARPQAQQEAEDARRQQEFIDADAHRLSQYEAEDARPQAQQEAEDARRQQEFIDADAHRLYEQEAEDARPQAQQEAEDARRQQEFIDADAHRLYEQEAEDARPQAQQEAEDARRQQEFIDADAHRLYEQEAEDARRQQESIDADAHRLYEQEAEDARREQEFIDADAHRLYEQEAEDARRQQQEAETASRQQDMAASMCKQEMKKKIEAQGQHEAEADAKALEAQRRHAKGAAEAIALEALRRSEKEAAEASHQENLKKDAETKRQADLDAAAMRSDSDSALEAQAIYGRRKDGQPCLRCLDQCTFCHQHKDQAPVATGAVRILLGGLFPANRAQAQTVFGLRKDGEPCQRCTDQGCYCFQHLNQAPGYQAGGGDAIYSENNSSSARTETPVSFGHRKDGKLCTRCIKQGDYCYQHLDQRP